MTDLKVVRLDANAGRREEVVQYARRLLELAEQGKITDLSYAASGVDGSVVTAFTATDDGPRRIAALSHLLHRFHVKMDEQAVAEGS